MDYEDGGGVGWGMWDVSMLVSSMLIPFFCVLSRIDIDVAVSRLFRGSRIAFL